MTSKLTKSTNAMINRPIKFLSMISKSLPWNTEHFLNTPPNYFRTDYNNRPSNSFSFLSSVHHQDKFRFVRVDFYSQLKYKVCNIFVKDTSPTIDGTPIVSRVTVHTLTLRRPRVFPLINFSPPIHLPLLRSPLPPLHLVCTRFSPPESSSFGY